MEDKNLTLEQEAQIKKKAAALKAASQIRKEEPKRWTCTRERGH